MIINYGDFMRIFDDIKTLREPFGQATVMSERSLKRLDKKKQKEATQDIKAVEKSLKEYADPEKLKKIGMQPFVLKDSRGAFARVPDTEVVNLPAFRQLHEICAANNVPINYSNGSIELNCPPSEKQTFQQALMSVAREQWRKERATHRTDYSAIYNSGRGGKKAAFRTNQATRGQANREVVLNEQIRIAGENIAKDSKFSKWQDAQRVLKTEIKAPGSFAKQMEAFRNAPRLPPSMP
jgi:hypothetical protein